MSSREKARRQQDEGEQLGYHANSESCLKLSSQFDHLNMHPDHSGDHISTLRESMQYDTWFQFLQIDCHDPSKTKTR